MSFVRDIDAIVKMYDCIDITQYGFGHVIFYFDLQMILLSGDVELIAVQGGDAITLPVFLQKVDNFICVPVEYITITAQLVQGCPDLKIIQIDRHQS